MTEELRKLKEGLGGFLNRFIAEGFGLYLRALTKNPSLFDSDIEK